MLVALLVMFSADRIRNRNLTLTYTGRASELARMPEAGYYNVGEWQIKRNGNVRENARRQSRISRGRGDFCDAVPSEKEE
jgi:hypothetical protein